MAAFLIFIDNNGILMWFMAVMLVHESAHILTLLLLGGRVAVCRLSVWGVSLTAERLSYGRELASVLAGPAASLAAAFAAAWAGLELAAGLSLVAGIYNLLPARCLDGGRALELALLWSGHPRAASAVLRVTTLLSAAALCVPLLAAFKSGVYNWSLLLSALLLCFTALGRDSNYSTGTERIFY